ncbi:PepSY-associated TM helix domain-containing protein [Methylobacterium sp.]|uniref:PepSY-associated TM helix domain-containing protein n=1 Tax=Methylobacterium sp. TaxID=409 RepID=UPI003B01D978
MKNGLRQSMAWLHTWSGLVVGWVLFAVFVTGTASYYRTDITAWMQPELRQAARAEPVPDLARAAEIGLAHLQAHAAGARSWSIGLPQPDRPIIDLFWRTKPGTPPNIVQLDGQTGEPATFRKTRGGDFLYRFHFELHMPPLWGRWIVGICAMVMLVALISGIITHRRIFADFFTLRRDKSAQRGWLDAHNVTGVLALPYHLMITYTGIVTLAMIYMPWGVTAAYNGDATRFYAETAQITAQRPPLGQPGTLAPIGPMVARAVATIHEPLERLSIVNPGDARSTVIAIFEEPHGLAHQHPQIAFDGTTGEIVEILQGGLKPAAKTFTTMVGLHEAHFAGPALRILFFLCGLMGCVMVASGLILWSVARLPKPGEAPSLGLRVVQALNIGTVIGLPAGIAVYFLANRVLPPGLEGRLDWEVRAFFGAWIVMSVVPLFRPHRAAWREMAVVTAILFLAVALADLLAAAAPSPSALLRHDPGLLWFDAAMVALAGLFALVAHKVAHFQTRKRAKAAPVGAPRTA